MVLKILGAFLVLGGSGAIGLIMVSMHKRKVNALNQLIHALDYMDREIQCRLTNLPQLCYQVAETTDGVISEVFARFAVELDGQISPDVETCMQATLCQFTDIPEHLRNSLKLLGHSIGNFDMEGQIKNLNVVRNECAQILEMCTNNQDIRLRNYQTIGLCAGAVLVIILI